MDGNLHHGERCICGKELMEFFDTQLNLWQLAKDHFADVDRMLAREINVGESPVQFRVIFNPARIRSTGADISKKTIENRKCFLCRSNRPEEQSVYDGCQAKGFEILVNPYPICNPHFTIPAVRHIPQNSVPLDLMLDFSNRFEGLCVFFNGAGAGASAPDHLHCQAVKTEDIPLLEAIEKYLPDKGALIVNGFEAPLYYPASFFYASGYSEQTLVSRIYEFTQKYRCLDLANPLLNAFMWKDSNGVIRAVFMPRLKHRPGVYYLPQDEGGMLISPGALDMAGLVVTVNKKDFERVDSEILLKVFEETAIAAID